MCNHNVYASDLYACHRVLVLFLGKLEDLVSDVVLVGKEESHLVLYSLSAWFSGGGQGSTETSANIVLGNNLFSLILRRASGCSNFILIEILPEEKIVLGLRSLIIFTCFMRGEM